jgi:hypothetical protein
MHQDGNDDDSDDAYNLGSAVSSRLFLEYWGPAALLSSLGMKLKRRAPLGSPGAAGLSGE